MTLASADFGIKLCDRVLCFSRALSYLHGIGELAVPPEIYDKPEKLTSEEMRIIRQHPYYTHRIWSMIAGLKIVDTRASLHRERLDGTGYPF